MAGQLVQQAVEQSVLRVAKQLEEQLDSELHKLENLQDDDLERIRQRRIHDLKQQQDKAREWVARGHGEYREVFEEKEFFKEMKGEERMVCHFFRDNWPCKVRGARGSCGQAGDGRQGATRGVAAAGAAWVLGVRPGHSSAIQHVVRQTWCGTLCCCRGPRRSWTSTWTSCASSTWRQSLSRCGPSTLCTSTTAARGAGRR